MKHRIRSNQFGRQPQQREALFRGLLESLVEHGRIKTTVERAKELRRHVEKAITTGKKGTVHARRNLLKKYPNKSTVKTIVDDLSVRFKERPGGYTRIIKLGHRPGDAAEVAFIEFVDYDMAAAAEKKEAAKISPRVAIRKAAARKRRLRKLQ